MQKGLKKEMGYRIGVLGNDFTYIKRLTDFIDSHYGDDIEISWGMAGIESLNIDVVGYDALLIGDDLEVDERKIPSGVKVIELTSKPADPTKLQILKFQKLESIYEQLMEICGSDAVQMPAQDDGTDEPEYNVYDRFADFVLTARRSNEGSYRVFQYSDKDIGEPDSLETGMLGNNNIQGIARLVCRDGELLYNVTGKQPLVDFVSKHDRDKGARAKLQKVFANIMTAVSSLDEYMLNADKLLLDPAEIYVDRNTLDIALIYCPFDLDDVEDDMYGLISEIMTVCGQLLDEIESNSGETTDVFSNLQKQADESTRTKDKTVRLDESKKTAYLVRKRTGEKIMIDKNIFKIGKDANYVDYCIKGNPTVSRNHADIVKKSDGYYAVDKGSLNHTFLNGRRLEEQEYEKLEPGDLLQVADEVFEFNIK